MFFSIFFNCCHRIPEVFVVVPTYSNPLYPHQMVSSFFVLTLSRQFLTDFYFQYNSLCPLFYSDFKFLQNFLISIIWKVIWYCVDLLSVLSSRYEKLIPIHLRIGYSSFIFIFYTINPNSNFSWESPCLCNVIITLNKSDKIQTV